MQRARDGPKDTQTQLWGLPAQSPSFVLGLWCHPHCQRPQGQSGGPALGPVLPGLSRDARLCATSRLSPSRRSSQPGPGPAALSEQHTPFLLGSTSSKEEL